MGNCVRKETRMEWGGEDWGYLASDDKDSSSKSEEKGLLKGTPFSSPSTTIKKTPKITEVKVKITKKQLEELLGKTDIERSSVQQVLTQLIHASKGYETHQRSWRPALQSIPESPKPAFTT